MTEEQFRLMLAELQKLVSSNERLNEKMQAISDNMDDIQKDVRLIKVTTM